MAGFWKKVADEARKGMEEARTQREADAQAVRDREASRLFKSNSLAGFVELFPDTLEWSTGWTKTEHNVVPYSSILDVHASIPTVRALSDPKVTVVTASASYEFKFAGNREAKEMHRIMQEQVLASRRPASAPTAAAGGAGVAAEIKALRELADSGVLTEEEFQAQKRKLLGT